MKGNLQVTPKVALVAGQWGQNIGNAFYNLGGRYVLERVFGEGSVQFIQDQPGYRTLHNKLSGNPRNYLDFARRLNIKYLVLQGPVLNRWMRINWQKTFDVLRERGVRVILLSCAFFKFTEEEIDEAVSFLREYPPALIATRDARSFRVLRDELPDIPKYNGIDSGLFISDCVQPFSVTGKPYVAINFDRYPEPTISLEPLSPKNYRVSVMLVGNRKWYLGQPKFLDWASRRSKIWAYLGDLTDRRSLPGEIDGFDLVRTEHRYFPHITYKIYRHPNSTASDEPWTYISIYANATFTLSDRVHACVATLAFGKPAMLFTPSPRAALFERIGAGQISSQLTSVDRSVIEAEKVALIRWLKNHV